MLVLTSGFIPLRLNRTEEEAEFIAEGIAKKIDGATVDGYMV